MARVLGEEHPYALTSMASLAFTFSFQGRKQVLGPQHPHTTSSLETLNGWQMENMEQTLGRLYFASYILVSPLGVEIIE
jgi:hypothetical protein